MGTDQKPADAGTQTTPAAKADPAKLPAGIAFQTGEAAPKPAVADANTKAAVEAAGFVLVKGNPNAIGTDVFESGEYRIGAEPVAVPADQLDALTAHRDDQGRQLVVKA